MKKSKLKRLQKKCKHLNKRSSSGYDLSETVCKDCGLLHGILGKDYGRDWNLIDYEKKLITKKKQ